MKDFMSLNFSPGKRCLWVITVLRLTLIVGIDVLNVDYMPYSHIVTVTNVVCVSVGVLYFFTCAAMIKIIRDAKKNIFNMNAPTYKKQLPIA